MPVAVESPVPEEGDCGRLIGLTIIGIIASFGFVIVLSDLKHLGNLAR